MLYGYLPAVVTGFLFTAIPNWTGRLPIQGMPLLALVVVWIAGRFVVTFSAETGWLAAMLVDAGFLVARRRGGGARDPGRAQLEKSQCGDAGSAAARRQCRVSSRGAFPRCRGNRGPDRHRGYRAADLADRGPHHSELYPQLAGARKSRPTAGAVRPVRRDRRGDQRRWRWCAGSSTPTAHLRRSRAGFHRVVASGAAGPLGRRPHRAASGCC